jgi:hypothetical protein
MRDSYDPRDDRPRENSRYRRSGYDVGGRDRDRDSRSSRAPEERGREEERGRPRLKKQPGIGDLLEVANEFGQVFKGGVDAYQAAKKSDLEGVLKGAVAAARLGGAVLDAYGLATGQGNPKDVTTGHERTLRRTKRVIAGMSGSKQYWANKPESSDSSGKRRQKSASRSKARDAMGEVVLGTFRDEVEDSIAKQLRRSDRQADTRPAPESYRSHRPRRDEQILPSRTRRSSSEAPQLRRRDTGVDTYSRPAPERYQSYRDEQILPSRTRRSSSEAPQLRRRDTGVDTYSRPAPERHRSRRDAPERTRRSSSEAPDTRSRRSRRGEDRRYPPTVTRDYRSGDTPPSFADDRYSPSAARGFARPYEQYYPQNGYNSYKRGGGY